MLHPSYAELIKVVNGDVEEGDTPVVNSRYSIVLATKREHVSSLTEQNPTAPLRAKPLSTAVEGDGLINWKVLGEEKREIRRKKRQLWQQSSQAIYLALTFRQTRFPWRSWKKRNTEVRRRALAVKVGLFSSFGG